MKRYLLFAYEYHDARGGWKDFIGSFDSIEETEQCYKEKSEEKYSFLDRYHIVDTTTWKII